MATTSESGKRLDEDVENLKATAEETEALAEEIEKEADHLKDEAKKLKEESKELNEEAEKVKEEVEDFKSKYYYLAAEMDNLRKRHDREKQNLVKFGNEKVLSGLLEVIDNLDRTLDAIGNDEDEKIKNVWTGIEMVRKQFLEVLKSNGLEQVETVGTKFDPNFHEAMAGQPAEGKENDEIITEFQKGYTLNGRLLRAAKVVIVNNR